MKHVPVLLKEAIDGLNIHAGEVVVDATLGGGGHTSEIVKRFGSEVKIIGFDLDSEALKRTKSELGDATHDLVFINANFRDLKKELSDRGVETVHRMLFDLGVSSPEIDDSGRGFSFQRDEPLLMTLTDTITEETLTAADIVNSWSEENLADIIYGFGEEKFSRRIAKAIVDARHRVRIETTTQLVAIIRDAVPKWYLHGKTHPATKTFQALRIAVNDELRTLETALADAFETVTAGGRITVITFHSLEDRIVKRAFLKYKAEHHAKIITKKPIVPSRAEILANPRSRSAKLRIIEK